MIRFLVDVFIKFAPVTVTKGIVWYFARRAPTRPRRWSMRHNFTSWVGLTDLSYNGRHLDEDPCAVGDPKEAEGRDPKTIRPRLDPRKPEDLERLKSLFLRRGRPQQDCHRSSVLFLFFAQWFTDAFLRTDADDHRRTDSNHEIDFCALYGLTEEKTNMLRFPLFDADGNVRRTPNGDPILDPETAHLLAFVEGPDGEAYPPKLYEACKLASGADAVRYRDQFKHEATLKQEGPDGAPVEVKVDRYLHDLDHMARITVDQSPEELLEYFAMGLEHGNGTLGYVVLNILMLRAHNKIAEEILAAHGDRPGRSKDRVFHVTRNVLTVMLLKIVVEDYVAHISDWPLKTPHGMADRAHWGKSNRIAIEFNLLYRWHSLVPDALLVDGTSLGPDDFRRKPHLVEKHGIAKLLTEFSRQPAGRMGLRNYPDFFAEQRTPDRPSTLERTLQIAYDSKLKPMNAYRRHFGLDPYRSFEDLVGDGPGSLELIAELKDIYGSIHHVDWFIGMMAEKHSHPVAMGQLMITMVANDAFTQALTNPLLSKNILDLEMGGAREVFSSTGLKLIDRISTLQDLSDYVLGAYAARCSFSY